MGRLRPILVTLVVACVSALVAAGCGGGGDAGGPSSASSGGSGGPKIITITAGRDQTGIEEKHFKQCSKQSGGKWKIEPFFLPPTVDGQREQMIRRLAAKDPTLDILGLDVIWTAEFSEAGWVLDLTDRIKPIEKEFIPAALDTARWKNKYWGYPKETNVAMLYYRTDLIKTPPKTWEELVEQVKEVQKKDPEMAGLLWQANQYEGLTVDALEFMIGAGGKILNEDASKSLINEGDGVVKGLEFMQLLFQEGITPKQVTTFHEEESRQMYQQGKAIFLRNWPYVYPLASGPGSKIIGKFDVVPLPGFEGKQPAGVLGGSNLAISAYSDVPEESWEAIKCLTSYEVMKERILVKGELPAQEAPYNDEEALRKVKYLKTAREALETAYSRPITPYYTDVTYSIYKNSNEVAAGRAEPAEAAKRMHESIQAALDGKAEI